MRLSQRQCIAPEASTGTRNRLVTKPCLRCGGGPPLPRPAHFAGKTCDLIELAMPAAELAEMDGRKLPEFFLALGRQTEMNHAAVVFGRNAPDKIGGDKTVDLLNGTVVFQKEFFCEAADRNVFAIVGLDREHRLVLLCSDARSTGRRFAEGKKSADRRTKRGERVILPLIK